MNDNYLINGESSSSLNPFDRGLAYGDGVFRTFKVLHGTPQHWVYHFDKLCSDAAALNITLPTQEILLSDIQLLFLNNENSVGKWIITRGSSERGYRIPKNLSPNRILLKSTYQPLEASIYTDGVCLEISPITVASHLPLGPIKHLSRLENVLAREAISSTSFDAIMLDNAGDVNECTSHTVVARFDKTLHFPQQKHGGVSGVSQHILLMHAKDMGFTCTQTTMPPSILFEADEIVITNAINGAVPIRQIQKKEWNSTKLAYAINTLFKNLK